MNLPISSPQQIVRRFREHMDASTVAERGGFEGDLSLRGVARSPLYYLGQGIVALLRHLDGYDFAFLALSLLLFVTVWNTVSKTTGILGADIGNYLLTMRQFFGDDPTGIGILRPPLVALPLKIVTSIFPLTTATKIIAVFTWVALGFPTYRLIRLLARDNAISGMSAIFGGLGFLLSNMFAVMLVFGWITFLGMALLPIIAIIIIKGLRNNADWRWIVLFALTAMVLAGTHQLTTVLAFAWLAAFTVGVVILKKRQSAQFIVKGGILTAIFSLWLAPLYLSLQSGTDNRFTAVGFQGLGAFWSGLSFFFREPGVWFWLPLMAVAVVGAVIIFRNQSRETGKQEAWLVLSLLVVPLFLNMASSSLGQRMLFFTYLPIWALASVALSYGLHQFVASNDWLEEKSLLVPGIALGAIAAIGITTFHGSFQSRLSDAMNFYNMVEDRHIQTSEFIASETSPTARLITYPFGLGWWIEGASSRDAFEIGRFGNKTQNTQSEVAERILVGNYSISNGALLAGDSYPDLLSGTPQFWVTLPGGERSPYAYFDDGKAVVTVLEHGIAERSFKLQAMSHDIEASESPESAQLVKSFTQHGLLITQETTLDAGSYEWQVEYRVASNSLPVTNLVLPMHFENLIEITENEDGSFLLTHRMREHNGQTYLVTSLLTLRARNANIDTRLGAEVKRRGNLYDRPLTATIEPLRNDFFTVIIEGAVLAIESTNQVTTDFSVSEGLFSEPKAYRSSQLVSENLIDYVVVDEKPFRRLDAVAVPTIDRLDGSPSFDVISRANDISIYRINPDRFEANISLSRTSRVDPPLQRAELGIARDLVQWQGVRSTGLQLAQADLNGSSVNTVEAGIALEVGTWSGVIFSSGEPLRWKGFEWISARVGWESVTDLRTLSIALEDINGSRWAWQRSGSEVEIDGGLQVWDLHRDDAARKDRDFDWDNVLRIHVTSLAKPEISSNTNAVQVGSIAALFNSLARQQ